MTFILIGHTAGRPANLDLLPMAQLTVKDLVPLFVTEHTFCISQDGSRYLDFVRVVPSNTRHFLHGLLLCGKTRS